LNAINKAVDDVKRSIPRQILDAVFNQRQYSFRPQSYTIEEQIINKIIKSRVIVDMDLMGGTEAFIPLENVPYETVNPYTHVFNIPKKLSQGRSIMSVLSVTLTSPSLANTLNGMNNINSCSVTPPMVAAQAMMDSYSPIPVTSTAMVQLIGENTVMVRDSTAIFPTGYLRCVLANDQDLNNIQMRAIPHVSKLVQLATKSYIYNDLVIDIDEARLSGGKELGKFRDIVEAYSDAEQMYQDYMKDIWSGVSFMNDRETMTRFIKLQLGSHR
jgi:hypothetical protein